MLKLLLQLSLLSLGTTLGAACAKSEMLVTIQLAAFCLPFHLMNHNSLCLSVFVCHHHIRSHALYCWWWREKGEGEQQITTTKSRRKLTARPALTMAIAMVMMLMKRMTTTPRVTLRINLPSKCEWDYPLGFGGVSYNLCHYHHCHCVVVAPFLFSRLSTKRYMGRWGLNNIENKWATKTLCKKWCTVISYGIFYILYCLFIQFCIFKNIFQNILRQNVRNCKIISIALFYFYFVYC